MAKDLAKLTDEQLIELNQDLMTQRDDLRTRQLQVKQLLDVRVAEAQANTILEGLTDVQRNALIKGAAAVGGTHGS